MSTETVGLQGRGSRTATSTFTQLLRSSVDVVAAAVVLLNAFGCRLTYLRQAETNV